MSLYFLNYKSMELEGWQTHGLNHIWLNVEISCTGEKGMSAPR
jgi:hypothetical protein